MKKKMGLTTKIVIGMIAGVVLGLLFGSYINVFQTVGDIFMRLLRMAVVPLIFINIIAGISQMDDIKGFGRTGIKLFIYYLSTMTVAVLLGVIFGFLIGPGVGVAIDQAAKPPGAESTSFVKVISDFVPANGIEAMAQGKLVQVILFAIFIGIAILMLPPEEKKRVSGFFALMAKLMIRVIMIVMELSPYGIAALTAVTVAKFGASIFGPLAKFVIAIYLAMIAHVLIVYFPVLFAFVRIRPLEFIRRSTPIWMTAATTCSSQATLPVEMETAQNKLGLPAKIVNFALPLGATMNSDGNAAWFGLIAVFTSQIFGLPMDAGSILQVAFLGVVLCLGSPGLPGGIFVATAIFLTALGYPVEISAMLMGIFRVMDIGLTVLNTTGDVVGVFVVSGIEKEFDRKTSPYWDAAPANLKADAT
jgi:Na+/H+-dicarboxylate symporter